MNAPTEESREWVTTIKKSLKELEEKNMKLKKSKKEYRLPLTMLPHREMSKSIDHNCTGNIRHSFHCVYPKEKFTTTDSKPLLRVNYECTICAKKVLVFLFESGETIIGPQEDLPDERHTPLGMGDLLNPAVTVKNGSKQKGFYTTNIDINHILKYEHPAKFETEEEIKQFEDHFPKQGAQAVAAFKSRAERSRVDKNKDSRIRTLYNPGRCEYLEPIASEIQKITGCQVNCRKHQATQKLFSKLSGPEKVVTFELNCR